jgi:hypothetical protein
MPDVVLSDPVVGGRRGRAFGTPDVDLSSLGYRADEFFIDGVAASYALAQGAERGWDGRWSVSRTAKRRYRTRILVIRPVEPSRFSGTVVLSWNNVTDGIDCCARVESPWLIASGSAYVGATVQRAGVHGVDGRGPGLVGWDEARYGELSIPTDDLSFDIFSQIAGLVGPARDRRNDLLRDLEVARVIAVGTSQSAGRLATYLNAVHPLGPVIDGFLLGLWFGNGSPLTVDGLVLDPRDRAKQSPRRGGHLLRDDIGQPVMLVNSELEAIACRPIRRPDTDAFRSWEVAGTTHRNGCVGGRWLHRDLGVERAPRRGANEVAMEPVLDAALHHVEAWVARGVLPPAQPRLDIASDYGATMQRDQHGIARGGLRLPEIAVPIATHSSVPISDWPRDSLFGSSKPFDRSTLATLYADDADLLSQFEAATVVAVTAGALLPDDGIAGVQRLLGQLPILERWPQSC